MNFSTVSKLWKTKRCVFQHLLHSSYIILQPQIFKLKKLKVNINPGSFHSDTSVITVRREPPFSVNLSFTVVVHPFSALNLLMASKHFRIKPKVLTIIAYKALHDLALGSLSKLINFHYLLFSSLSATLTSIHPPEPPHL